MCYLREATSEDRDLLFEWANDPVVRMNSFHSDPISYEEHKNWFNRIMNDENSLQFIMMEEDKSIGQIRLTICDDEATIGYSIGIQYRGKGYGHIILELIADEIKNSYPEIRTLNAKVKPDNIASNALFEKAGYEKDYISYSYRLFDV